MALRDEWKGTYPGIGEVLEKFRRAPARMSREDMQSRLDDAMLLLSDEAFEGVLWLTDVSSQMWTPNPNAEWEDLYQPLLRILYRIGLIGASPRVRAAPVFFGDDPLFVEQKTNLRGAKYYYIHQTYHRGLEVQESGERGSGG
ncbi:MAG: hypothetical protein M3P70_01480 [Actinomycetota bacterium]|nr:hypothetical protein [Actinomycetota bacterium]